MRVYVSIIFIFVICQIAWSIPAAPYPIVHVAEDGHFDTIYLYGDEHNSYRAKRHNQIPLDSGFFPKEKLQIYSNIVPAHAPQRQMLQSYMPSKGNVQIPVLLVNFADYNFSIKNPITQFNDFFNGKGGSNPQATGSVHEYFIASSDSVLDLQYDVFGVYTLSHKMEYYGANQTNNYGITTNHNIHARELVTEAVQLAIENGVNFSKYDNNNDGYIDNVSIIVAGYNEAEGGIEHTIWPHYSEINDEKKYSSKSLSGYLIISEYRSSGGQVQAGIGTYCHEFGHALGLPDLYDTNISENYTIGYWDIMCSGSYNNNGSTPPTYSAFERFMMGWLKPIPITKHGLQIIPPIETSNEAYIISDGTHNLNAKSPSPSEYFLLENRQTIGWDAGNEALEGTGLLISHITFDKNRWDYNTFNNQHPLGYDIVSAGMAEPTKSSAADVFPGTTKRTTWIPQLNNGTLLLDKAISQIRQRNDLCISMHVGKEEHCPLSFGEEEIRIETTYGYNPEKYDTAHIILHIDSLKCDSIRLTLSSDKFSFSADNGLHWYSVNDTLRTAIIPNSTYDVPLLVIHTPKQKSCNYTYAFLTAETLNETNTAQITIAGRAPRATYITTPKVDSVTCITSSSFQIHWTPQEDADKYYYTLYTIGEGESEEKETFNAITSLADLKENGWETNFANPLSSTAGAGMTIVFNKSEQFIQTPRYTYPPKAISAWLSNDYTYKSTDSEIGGKITISGTSNGITWEKIRDFYVQNTTKDIVLKTELDTTHDWRQFRITYTHIGGNGGTIIDDWTITYAQNIEYIYPLRNSTINAPTHSIVFNNLNSSTTYYFSLQAYEEKGCEHHHTSLSEPIAITTGEQIQPQLKVTRNNQGEYSIILPETTEESHTLAIYDYTGQLILQIQPSIGELRISLPPLSIGQLYIVKYYNNKIRSKDLNTKILYY